MSAPTAPAEVIRETEHRIPGLIPGHVVVIITRVEKEATLPVTAPPAPQIPDIVPLPPTAITPDINWDTVPAHPALPVQQSSTQFNSEIPHPRDLHPRDLHHRGKFYTIFHGREVGIFYDAITEVRPHIDGVPHALMKGYKSWEEALMEYTQAYKGEKVGWEIAVINPENVAFPLEGENWDEPQNVRYWADQMPSGSGTVIISDTESDS
ncbi:hypothetical protein VNI00_017844 [Paramarasmius palmivorus]|uniref:Ribonuclease H1 N-terminal domain-containing protein n=1 Tax=Paramarasmius palmivorus TaxID=297713 RepID=A0AAW0B3F3_9AGAR